MSVRKESYLSVFTLSVLLLTGCKWTGINQISHIKGMSWESDELYLSKEDRSSIQGQRAQIYLPDKTIDGYFGGLPCGLGCNFTVSSPATEEHHLGDMLLACTGHTEDEGETLKVTIDDASEELISWKGRHLLLHRTKMKDLPKVGYQWETIQTYAGKGIVYQSELFSLSLEKEEGKGYPLHILYEKYKMDGYLLGEEDYAYGYHFFPQGSDTRDVKNSLFHFFVFSDDNGKHIRIRNYDNLSEFADFSYLDDTLSRVKASAH